LKSKVKVTWNENVTRSQAVARIADRTALQQMLNFRENYLCACSAFPIQSRVPNLKPLAQAVFEILRSKRIGVTNLTFQGHVTSLVTWPFDSPYTISYWWFFGTKPLSLFPRYST